MLTLFCVWYVVCLLFVASFCLVVTTVWLSVFGCFCMFGSWLSLFVSSDSDLFLVGPAFFSFSCLCLVVFVWLSMFRCLCLIIFVLLFLFYYFFSVVFVVNLIWWIIFVCQSLSGSLFGCLFLLGLVKLYLFGFLCLLFVFGVSVGCLCLAVLFVWFSLFSYLCLSNMFGYFSLSDLLTDKYLYFSHLLKTLL